MSTNKFHYYKWLCRSQVLRLFIYISFELSENYLNYAYCIALTHEMHILDTIISYRY